MKISVLAARYAISGVPLAQLRFAKALANAGHDVDLVFGAVNTGYILPDEGGLNIMSMDKEHVSAMLFPLIRYLVKIKPDIIFSAGDHLNAVILLAAIISNSKAKVSCSSRVTPFDTYSNVPFSKRWILKQMMLMVMRRADNLTCVSEDMVDQYKSIFKSPRHMCIYNIIDDKYSRIKMNESVDEPWLNDKSMPILIAAGNLAPWKGFTDLILAMHEVLKVKDARLIILGDGPLKNELNSLIIKLNIQKFVKLKGYVENPLKYFRRANIFILSSHVEGMPNVLVEAIMCGCTPVATNCPTGPREVLKSGEYGYLVPVSDPIALAAGILRAIDCPIHENILQDAVRPFSSEAVLKKHFDSLNLSS
jgi:glycosyltransferase involved in cell wall biosynthesis